MTAAKRQGEQLILEISSLYHILLLLDSGENLRVIMKKAQGFQDEFEGAKSKGIGRLAMKILQVYRILTKQANEADTIAMIEGFKSMVSMPRMLPHIIYLYNKAYALSNYLEEKYFEALEPALISMNAIPKLLFTTVLHVGATCLRGIAISGLILQSRSRGSFLAKEQEYMTELESIYKELEQTNNQHDAFKTSLAPYYHLIAGEIFRIQGTHEMCHEHYSRAIEHSKSEGYSHIQAIALDRYAGFYKEVGNDVMHTSLISKSRQYFREWGAHLKAESQEGLLRSIAISAAATTAGAAAAASAESDFELVMKDPEGWSLFSAFLEKCFCSEMCGFLEAMKTFKDLMANSSFHLTAAGSEFTPSMDTMLKLFYNAKEITGLFIEKGSEMEINIDAELKQQAMEVIKDLSLDLMLHSATNSSNTSSNTSTANNGTTTTSSSNCDSQNQSSSEGKDEQLSNCSSNSHISGEMDEESEESWGLDDLRIQTTGNEDNDGTGGVAFGGGSPTKTLTAKFSKLCQLLGDIESHVVLTIQQDNFPRFVKTSEFKYWKEEKEIDFSLTPFWK